MPGLLDISGTEAAQTQHLRLRETGEHGVLAGASRMIFNNLLRNIANVSLLWIRRYGFARDRPVRKMYSPPPTRPHICAGRWLSR
jgi:hypothetical protein